MSDPNVYDKNAKYDQQRNQWYWDGRRPDGRKVRKYHPAESQTTQYDANQYVAGYQSTQYDPTTGLEGGMQGMNLQQQPAETYSISASNYATWPAETQSQGPATYTGESSRHRRRDEGIPSDHQATPRTVPAPSGYQAHSGSNYEHFQQQPLASAQESTNVGYGLGGDSTYQNYGQDKGKSVAGPRSGRDASAPQPESSVSYGQYGGHYGTSQYGQCKPPKNATLFALLISLQAPSDDIHDQNPQDRPRKSKHKGKGKSAADSSAYHFRDEQRAVDYGGSQNGGYSYSAGTNIRRPSGTPSDTAGFLQEQDDPYASGSRSRLPIFPESLDNLGGTGDDGDDAELQAGIDASREAYGYGAPGGRSTGGGPAYQIASDNAPPPVPYPGSSRSRDGHISGTEGRFERLDPRFKVERSSRFEPGEVFKVMWTEPRGERPPPVGGGSVITELVHLQDHLDNVWTGFRRFIVVANDEGHCTCVPILTYGNQGCSKSGVKPHKHGIVYEHGRVPAKLKKEPKLGFDPVCMQITAVNERISEDSRVNYSKLVTIEHNVKVFFIGHISYEDWPMVIDAVDKCWGDKKREKSHHSSRRDKR